MGRLTLTKTFLLKIESDGKKIELVCNDKFSRIYSNITYLHNERKYTLFRTFLFMNELIYNET